MANWRYNIELNRVISEVTEEYNLEGEELCPDEAKEALAAEVEKAPPLTHFGQRIRKCKSVAGVNRLLDEIYDAADAALVWYLVMESSLWLLVWIRWE
jgi:hypothetical protein